MYKKKLKKEKKKLVTIISIVIVIFLLVLSINTNRDIGFIENIFKNITMITNKIIMYPINAKVKDKDIDSYLIQKNINSSLEKEIEELKDVLELNKTLTEYDKVNATILSRNKSYWFNTLTIDKGKSSGIKKDMAVITKNGLIGKISKVSNNSSEVKLITSDDINFKVSIAIRVNDIDQYAILNGYDKKNNLVIATGIDKTVNVNVGDPVITSGLGEMFPTGIYIGNVEKIESDKYNLSKKIYIKTKQDFNNVHYLTVLKVK